MTDQNNRNKKIFRFLNSPTFRYQQTLTILLFVSATLIFLDLGIFSVSFIFGVALILITLSRKPALLKPKGLMWFLFAFLIFALLSFVFSELSLVFGHLKLYIQTVYWFLLSVIIFNLYPLINKRIISKYILFSVLLLLLLYVAGFKVGSQNSIAFTVIILAPLGYYYIKNFWFKVVFASLLVFLMLLNGSRSGAIISFLQSCLIILLTLPKLNKYFKTISIIFVLLIGLFTTEAMLSAVGSAIYPYNDRLGELMMNTEYILRNDMSWLQRQAQIQKGKQIFAEHPVLGVGYTNFVAYDVNIDEREIEADRSLRNIDNRSSHNSYINWLAETGALGFGSMIFFFITILTIFWKRLRYLPGQFASTLFVSFLGMLIYFYTISAYLGTSTWIMYGIIAGGASAIKKRIISKVE